MRLIDVQSTLKGVDVFSDWLTVKDAKDSGLIPEPWHQFFDDNCECGSENIISGNRKQCMCCDPACKFKIGYSLSEMFSRFGVLGLGSVSCQNIWNDLLNNDELRKARGDTPLITFGVHTDVLAIERKDMPSYLLNSAIGETFISGIEKIRSGTYTFVQLVGNLGITGFNTGADRLFGGVNNVEELAAVIEHEGGLVRYCQRRGVQSEDVIYKFWGAIKPVAVASFNMKNCLRVQGSVQCKICMTGHAKLGDVGMTKNAYVEKCMSLCKVNGIQLMEIVNTSGPATCDFVLFANEYRSNKYNVGEGRGIEYGNFGEKKVLISCDQFYNWLQKGVEQWKETGGDFKQILTNITV